MYPFFQVYFEKFVGEMVIYESVPSLWYRAWSSVHPPSTFALTIELRLLGKWSHQRKEQPESPCSPQCGSEQGMPDLSCGVMSYVCAINRLMNIFAECGFIA